jgi:hypothetical protein
MLETLFIAVPLAVVVGAAALLLRCNLRPTERP